MKRIFYIIIKEIHSPNVSYEYFFYIAVFRTFTRFFATLIASSFLKHHNFKKIKQQKKSKTALLYICNKWTEYEMKLNVKKCKSKKKSKISGVFVVEYKEGSIDLCRLKHIRTRAHAQMDAHLAVQACKTDLLPAHLTTTT